MRNCILQMKRFFSKFVSRSAYGC